MVEEINFMDPYMPSRSTQVIGLTSQAKNILSNPELTGLDETIQKYEDLKLVLLSLESKVYNLFQVKDMFELNRKIETFTNGISGLNALAENLMDNNIVDYTDVNSITKSADFAKAVQYYVAQDITDPILIDQAILDWAKQYFENSQKAESHGKIKGQPFTIAQKLTENLRGHHTPLKDYKERLRIALLTTKASCDKNTISIPIEISPIDQNIKNTTYIGFKASGQNPLTQYSPEEIRISLYNLLVSGVNASFTGYLKQAIDRFPLEDLLIPKEIGNIRGLIGELTMDMMILYLFNGSIPTEISAIQGGGLRNALNNNAKIGIDYFLNECGFQVKNYTIVGGKFTSNIHLKLNNKLNTWATKMNLQGEVQEAFRLIWAIYNYNVPDKATRSSSNIDYTPIYKSVSEAKDMTKGLFLMHPDSILRISEAIDTIGLDNATYYNVFFYVSNQFLVPSSFIIDTFIKYLNMLKRKGVSALNDSGVSVSNSNYSGPKYKRGQRIADIPLRSSIYNSISIEAGYNLPLVDFINDRIKSYQGGQ